MKGYFSIDRALLDHPLWKSEPFTRGQAWVDLIGLANYAPNFIRPAGVKIEILRGQCGWSEVSLSERWKWSRGKVQRFLNELKNDARIAIKTSNRITIITICNYDEYQGGESADDTAGSTADEQQTSSRQDTKKKDNKDKKDNNTPLPPNRFEEFYAIYPRKEKKPAAAKAYERAIERTDQQTIIDGARRYADSIHSDDRPNALKFAAHPSTWLNNDCWNDIPAEPEEEVIQFEDYGDEDRRIENQLRRLGLRT